MANQLKILQEINKAQNDILSVLEAQTQVMQGQLGMANAIKDAMAGEKISDVIDRLFEMRDAANEAGEKASEAASDIGMSAEKSAESLDKTSSATKGLLGKMKKLALAAPIAAFKGFFDGAMKGFSLVKTSVTSSIGLMGQLVTSAFSIGTAILSIPFKIFNNLIAAANKLAQAFKHIAEAYESFRKDFGDLNNEIGQSMKGALEGAEQMGQFGIGFYQIFTDQAAAIKFFGETFQALGPMIDTFGSEIAGMGEEFVILTKGLGLTGDHLKGVGNLAKSSGRDMKDVLVEIGAQATIMEETFGVSSKLIGKDLGEMIQDVHSFGNNSIETLGASAMRIRSLGIEVKTLGKLIDKFLNFEDAARNASMLSQSFGVNLDALKLMNGAAKGGADTLDQLRNAMFSAGRDAAKMSTAELRLLAQTTGLSEGEARLAFSMKNRGKSMEDIRNAAKKTNPQERMADTMERLGDNIERIIRVFDFKSFFGAFFKGFSKGASLSKPFTEMLSGLYESLNIVHWAGVTVGKLFVRLFPNIDKMIESFKGVFNPEVFEKFQTKLVDTFEFLFKALGKGGDPVEIMTEFWGRLQKAFGIVNIFGGDTMSKFEEGFLQFLGGLRDIIIGSLPLIKDKIIEGIDIIVGLLTGTMPETFKNAKGEVSGFAGQLWIDIFKPIWEALVRVWEDPVFQNKLGKLGDILLTKLSDLFRWVAGKIVSNPKAMLVLGGALALIIGGPAIFEMIISAFGILAGMIAPLLGTLIPIAIEAAGGIGAILTSIGTALGPILTGIGAILANPIAWVVIAGTAMAAMLLAFGPAINNGMTEFWDDFKTKFQDKGERKLGSAVAGIVDMLTFGLLPDNLVVKVGEKAVEIFQSIKKALKKIPILGGSISDAFGDQLESTLDVFSTFGSIVKDVFEGKGLDEKKIQELGKNIGSMIWNGFKLSLGILTVILSGVAYAFIRWGTQLPAMVLEWTTLMIGYFFDFAAGLLSQIPVVGSFASSLMTFIGSAFKFVSSLIGGVVTVWGGLVDALTEWDSKKFTDSIEKAFSSVFGLALPKLVLSFVKMLKESFAGMIPGVSGMLDEAAKKLEGTIAKNEEMAKSAADAGKNAGKNLSTGMDEAFVGPTLPTEKIKTDASSIGKLLPDIPVTGMDEAFVGPMDEAFVGPVLPTEKIKADASSIEKLLSNIPEIDVPVKIEPVGVGNVLGVKDNKLEITSKALNLVLNLNVTVESDKLAKVILDTKKIMPKAST